MSTHKRTSFMQQAAILAAAGLFARFLGFLYRPPMTSIIGDDGIGIYSGGYYIYTFLLVLSSAGLPAAIGKMVSERLALNQHQNAHRVFRVSMVISATMGFICMLILLIWAEPIANLVNNPKSAYTLISLAPTLFIVAIMSVYRGYFQGMNTMIPTAISQVVEQIFNAVFSVVLAWIFVKQSVAMGAAGGTAGTGIGAIAGLLVVWVAYRLIKPRLFENMARESKTSIKETNKDIAKELIKTAMPIIIGSAIFSITNLFDMTMVMSRLIDSGAFTTAEAEVLYGQLAGKYVVLTTLPVSIATAMATAAVPSIAKSVVLKDTEMIKKKIDSAFRIAMIISIPAAVGIGVLGDQILLMLFPSYPGGGILLKVGSVSIVFLAMSQIVTGILQGIGKVSTPAINAGIGAIFKLILNYVLIVIPSINVVGAVISTTACYMVAAILNTVVLTKSTGVKMDLIGGFVKPTISSLIMGVGCYGSYLGINYLTQSNIFSTLMSIFIGMIIYAIAMISIKGISSEDLALMPMGGKLKKFLNMAGFSI